MRLQQPEHAAQCQVVAIMRASGIVFAASMNAQKRGRREGRRAVSGGMEAGEPDLCIYDRPPSMPECIGMMMEMKTAAAKPKTSRAHRWSGATKHQRDRMELLEARGWRCVVGYGAVDAINKLKAAGYPLVGV